MKGYSFRSLTDLVLKIFKTRVIAGTGLSGGGSLEADRTLSVKYGTAAGTAAQGNDGRLSNSREWTGVTISQDEAEAGSATTRRAFTAQRVRQAIVAWFNGISGTTGRTILGRSTSAQVRGDLGLGTAATKNVGISTGQVPEFVSSSGGLGGFGYGRVGTNSGSYDDVKDVPQRTGFYLLADGYPDSTNNKATGVGQYDTLLLRMMRHIGDYFTDLYIPYGAGSPGMVIAPHGGNKYGTSRIVSDSLNLRTSTGQSTSYPMTQKAVTDALGTKVNTSTQVIAGTGLSGGGNLSANHTLSVNYGTAAGTAAQGNDSRLSNSREWTAATVSQAEAEAGTTTTRRAWTAQRVRQAILGWWSGSADKAKLDGIADGAQVNVATNLGSSGTGATRTINSSTGSSTSITYSAADVGAVPTERTITAGTGLTGGGSLAANRTLSVNYGSIAGTAAQGNDSRIVNSVQTSGNQTVAGVKTFSSFPVTPSTAPTTNYQAANKEYVDDRVDDKVNGSAIGVGQTWQNVTGSRVSGTTYTNTTGRTIYVSVAILDIGAGYAEFFVDSVKIGQEDIGSTSISSSGTISSVIPSGSTYKIESAASQSIISWAELR